MTYTPPRAVTSPRDCIKKIHVIYDGRDYSVAKLEWEDPDQVSGQMVRVVMPKDIVNRDSEVWKLIDNAWPTDAKSKPCTIS